MTSRNDIGESSASIRAREDREKWPRVREALHQGATLYRPAKLKDYYTHCRDDRDPLHGLGITAALVKRLETQGVLRIVGVDRYGLVPDESSPLAASKEVA